MNNTSRYIYYGSVIFLISIIIYKLYMYSREESYLEHFSSKIKNFKNKQSRTSGQNKLNNNNKNNKNNLQNKLQNKLKSKSGVTFDDIISESEAMNVEKYTLSSVKEDFWSYVNSFKSDKFKNVTGTNNESLEKLYMFKDKFFEIFD